MSMQSRPAVRFRALTSTPHQERCRAVHFSFHHGNQTIAQACTALNLPWQTPLDVERYLVYYRAWCEGMNLAPRS
ncbi:hypothetical protein [Deinococcus yavapaiensis]|uniref:Uncharacterized protein n=1 Tax=Deinococcus yavapaiensis KR-236 TaxID=694435 RepID=A0A318SHS3_9DEIO|nr:hypothetical protein [Deinococcus yavapaiensis]PYE50572.1 hypothetical protein DES52_11790 [Deinococcus yavapaiensis KR-236]